MSSCCDIDAVKTLKSSSKSNIGASILFGELNVVREEKRDTVERKKR